MKSDARLLLNHKKWGQSQRRPRISMGPSRTHALDARDILESKRKTVHPRMIQSRVARPMSQRVKVGDSSKKVHLMKDGNLFVTSRQTAGGGMPASGGGTRLVRPAAHPHSSVDVTVSSRNTHTLVRPLQEQDDLECLGIEDLMDLEQLPNSLISQPQETEVHHRLCIPEHSMVADRISASESGQRGARVLVTNLGAAVSREDLVDLFGAAGPVSSAELLSGGRAMVTFLDRRDAVRACNLYHQRLLDSQPMGCFLQPEESTHHTPVLKRLDHRLYGEPQTFTASRSSAYSTHDPRNVQFIVRL